MNIKVAIVDDQDIIQKGIQLSLSTAPFITFYGGYFDLEAFFQSKQCASTDVVLLDDSLSNTDTFQAIQQLQARCPETTIILLGSQLTPHGIHYAIDAGATGVICKQDPIDDILIAGIQRAYTGQVVLSAHAALIGGRIGELPKLSKNLYQVLRLIARGYRIPQMMQELGIGRGAVYARRERLREALDVETNEQIVAEAIRRGILSPDDF